MSQFIDSVTSDVLEHFQRNGNTATCGLCQDPPRRLEALRNAYKSSGLTLVLGAGISIPSGIPSWPTLLRRMAKSILSDTQLAQLDRLKTLDQNVGSSLIVSRALKLQTRFPDRLRQIARQELYSALDLSAPNTLLKAVSKLLRAAHGAKLSVAILTYNFDSLLEHQLLTDDPSISVVAISDYEDGTQTEADIKIRHVHGYMPQPGFENRWGGMSRRIVLSEDEYHAEYATMFGLSGTSQANSFNSSTCLFLGLSMTDPNIRRILDAVAKKPANCRHVAVYPKSELAASLCGVTGLADEDHRYHDQIQADLIHDMLVCSHQLTALDEACTLVEQIHT